MIRYQITGKNPIEMNTAAMVLLEHGRLEVEQDSGNRNGRKDGYVRYIHARVKHKTGKITPRKPPLDGAAKMSLAIRCWHKIVHQTDSDDEAVSAIIELIEHVERKLS